MAVKSDTSEMKVEVEAATQHTECKLYKRRWLILAIFVMYSMSNSMQWIQFAIIGDVVSHYYHNVDAHFINWTSMVYMITYIPLIFPASFFLDKKGLRMSAIVGAVGTCLGSWIKVGGIERDMFPVAFVGQTLVAMSQVFILSLPAQLAAVWFGPNEVSSACSIGVFGNQLGIAVGFLVPPLMVKVRETMEETKMDFTIMFYSVAIFTTALLVLIIVFFKDHPELPPSPAQALVRDNVENKDFKGTLTRLFTNVPYILLLISYGLNVGVFYAISTLLNQIVVMHFPGKGEDAGRIGLIMVLAGMVGSIIAGYVLDKTRRFKETTLVLYIFSLGGMILYTITLDFGDLLYVYLSGGILGFFMTGYLPVGFELAAELTYPEPEGISAGILNAAVQIFGIGLTNLDQLMVDHIDDKWANIALCICLAIGIVITILIKNDLRRQRAQNTDQRTNKTEESTQ